MYYYIKALHIIFVVTWFAGLFYIVRLFIYNREACDQPEVERKILQSQFKIMIRRLWLGIAWPSCILTIIFGTWMLILFGSFPVWLMVKIGFVIGLLLYHMSIQIIYKQQLNDRHFYTSQQLRLWNEVATLFLVAIVMLAVVKSILNLFWASVGFVGFILVLLLVIRIYRNIRKF